MLKEVKKILDEIIDEKEKLVVGVSGGPDSICLLHLLIVLKYNIVVAHINHCVRVDADDDEEYVKSFCKKYKIKFYSKKINIVEKSKIEKIGLEEAGRKARYSFFEEIYIKEKANKIVTAHNKNDLAETIIMNVLRGAGINGLKAIEALRDNKYIKPLVGIERNEIEKYCEENKLNPRIDSTNFDNTYTRNKIRNVVIPYIKQEFNPNIISALTRLSEIATEDIRYIESKTEEVFKDILVKQQDNNIILDLKAFNIQELAIKKRIILYSIENISGTKKGIEKIHIDDIIKLCANNIGNKYLTPNKNIKIMTKSGQIILSKVKQNIENKQ